MFIIINSDNILEKIIFGENYNNSNYKKNIDKVYENKISGISKSKKYLQNAGLKSGNENIAIAITSAWIKEHGEDFKVLIKYQESGKLNIAWVNHTKTHKYNFSNDFSTTFYYFNTLK